MKDQSYSDILRREAARQESSRGRLTSGTVKWSCPSNIALVKYWGKRPVQLPMNPSLSLSLKNALTTTNVKYTHDPGISKCEINFRFEGKAEPAFKQRIQSYIRNLEPYLPVLSHSRFSEHCVSARYPSWV